MNPHAWMSADPGVVSLPTREGIRYPGRVLTLWDYGESGNGYKVRLLLRQLGRPFKWRELDIVRGETHTPEFLAKNPNGKIPLLELEDGSCLAESNAILWYLAEGSAFLPDEPLDRAHVLQWMSFEQYSHEPNIAVLRFWAHTDRLGQQPDVEREKRSKGEFALGVMEEHLMARTFFVAERYTIADIALYAYTHVAEQGGFSLTPYPATRAWLDRVRAQPAHVAITDLPTT